MSVAIMSEVNVVKGGFKTSYDAIRAIKRGEIQANGDIYIGLEPLKFKVEKVSKESIRVSCNGKKA